eukprot:804397-Karenia_brevis.AAC.1
MSNGRTPFQLVNFSPSSFLVARVEGPYGMVHWGRVHWGGVHWGVFVGEDPSAGRCCFGAPKGPLPLLPDLYPNRHDPIHRPVPFRSLRRSLFPEEEAKARRVLLDGDDTVASGG